MPGAAPPRTDRPWSETVASCLPPSTLCAPENRATRQPTALLQRRCQRLRHLEALDRGLVEGEAQPRLLRHHELTALERRRLLEEPQRPRHVLDGETVGNRRDQMHVDL